MRFSRVALYFVFVVFFTMFNFYYRPVKSNTLVTDSYKKSEAYVNNLYKSDEYFKKKLVNKEYYYIYDQMINDSVSGVEETNILCTGDCIGEFQNIYKALYLDHPELISFQSIMGARISSSEIKIKYNNLSSLQSYLGTRRIEREIDLIKKETKGMSDQEKIIYVYDYVAKHQYDHIFMYSKGNQSAYSFFTKGISVCAGFAKASQIIFQNIGINSYLVMDDDHMWNYVEYNKKYYVFDATMGASLFTKDNTYFYDGLGETTVGVTTGFYPEFYPKIEDDKLEDLFNLQEKKFTKK